LCGFSFANCFGERLPAEFHATLDAITISQHTMNPSFGVIRLTQKITNVEYLLNSAGRTKAW
jgi:hypothetical protein